jgi:pimeloyl-ACP methyl ester carboxylesterase
MRRVLAGTAVTVALVATLWSSPASSSGAGAWTGRYRLVGADELSVTLDHKRALVALGAAHAELQSVPVARSGAHIRFAVPGRPAAVSFDGMIAKGMFSGTVRQGATRGTFSLHAGSAPSLGARGVYRVSGGVQAVVDDPYGPARIVDLDSGRVRALLEADASLSIGSGFATSTPRTGTASFSASGGRIDGKRAARVRVRQFEVRFRSGSVNLAGTLSIPPGAGKHAAVAFVHGSGSTNRAYLPELSELFVRHGVAVLVYDKRGVGQSGGVYPGESPTAGTIDTLARDAAAAARFLAAQPEVDRTRVGLSGHSQAGWIAPLAAAREPAIRFLVLFSGPAVTAEENDVYQDLAGGGDRPQTMTDAAIDAEVLKHGPGGFDPIPLIRKLSIPALWLYGGLDHIVPIRLSEGRLEPIAAEAGRDFRVVDLPRANHALVETKTGLTSEMLRSDMFAPGLFEHVGDWLESHHLATPLG